MACAVQTQTSGWCPGRMRKSPGSATIDFSGPLADNWVMTRVSIDELEKALPAFIQRVQAGEAFVITREGNPLAEIPPFPHTSGPPPFGLSVGDFVVPDDFDEPLPQSILQEFEG